MECNASTFLVEMKEMGFILENVQAHSLVLLDELGRGTAPQDGLAIAWACCESLLTTSAFSLCVTHFHELTVRVACQGASPGVFFVLTSSDTGARGFVPQREEHAHARR